MSERQRVNRGLSVSGDIERSDVNGDIERSDDIERSEVAP